MNFRFVALKEKVTTRVYSTSEAHMKVGSNPIAALENPACRNPEDKL